MISKTPSFQTSDGTPYNTLEKAQRHELVTLLDKCPNMVDTVDAIISNSDAVIDILRATGRKPRERKKSKV